MATLTTQQNDQLNQAKTTLLGMQSNLSAQPTVPQATAPAATPNPTPNPGSAASIPTPTATDASAEAARQNLLRINNADANQNVSSDAEYNSALGHFQSQIDSTNAVYNDMLNKARVEGQNRLGSNRAMDARSGLLGSDFGNAHNDSVVAKNTGDETAIQNQRAEALAKISGAARTAGQDAYNAKLTARKSGAEAVAKYYTETLPNLNAGKATTVAKALAASKIDPSTLTPEQQKQIESQWGIHFGDVSSAYNSLKDANQKADLAGLPASAQEYKYAQQNGYKGTYSEYQNEDANRKAVALGKGATLVQPGTGKTIAHGSAAGGSGVAVPTARFSAGQTSASHDAQAVLEGRDSLLNIRMSRGKSKNDTAYIQSVKDEIYKSDPSFDFNLSNAGTKLVSSQYYQRASASIASVLPNIDTIVKLSDQVPRIGVKGVDALLQAGQTQINNQKVANFHEAQKLIADEIGVALGAGTVSDMKLQLGFDVTDPSVSPEVFASNMHLVKEFLNNRKAGLDSGRYKSTTVQTPTGTGANTVTDPTGTVHTFKTAADAQAFKQEAGL